MMEDLYLKNVQTKDMANILGVTRQTLYIWAKERNLPRNENGKYNLIKVFRWITDQYRLYYELYSKKMKINTRNHAFCPSIDWYKVCHRCLRIKSIDEFTTDNNQPDKKNLMCAECTKINSREFVAAKKSTSNFFQSLEIIKKVKELNEDQK